MRRADHPPRGRVGYSARRRSGALSGLQPRYSETAMLKISAAVAAFLALWTVPAYAYLDPTTGSILLQGLLAGIAGVMMVGRLFWTRLKAFFRKLMGSHSET
jgi:hypothetical protein